MGQNYHTWEIELQEAGWEQVHTGIWQSPTGEKFRGPYGAWCAMQGQKPVPNPPSRSGSPE